MGKKILIGLAVLAVVLIGALLILLSRFDSETLGKEILTRTSEATGIALSAEGFDISLFSGLDLTNVTAEGEYAEGHYRAALDKLSLRYRLRPLLQGTISVSEILLERPDVNLMITGSRGEQRPESTPPAASTSPTQLRLEVSEIRLTDGHILITEQDNSGALASTTEISGLAIVLRDILFSPTAPTPIEQVSGSGTVSAAQVRLNKLTLRDLQGNLSLSGGVAQIQDLEAASDYGELATNLSMDLKPQPFVYEFSASGDPIGVNQIVGLGPDGSLGPGDLSLNGSGRGSDPAMIDADGTLNLTAGRIPDHPILAKASSILGLTGLVGAPYESSPAQFRLQNGRVTVEGFDLKTETAAIDFSGWAELDGPLSLTVGMRIPRQGVQIPRVPPVVLDALADSDGWIRIPMKVTGTRDNPQVGPDLDYLLEQGSRGAGKKLLDSLFGRGN